MALPFASKRFDIQVQGQPLSKLGLTVIEAEVQYAVNRIPMARLTCRVDIEDPANSWASLGQIDKAWQPAHPVKISYTDETGTRVPIFDGMVARPLNPSYVQRQLTCQLEVVHELQKMANSHRSQVLTQKGEKLTDAQALQKLFKEHGIKVKKMDGMTVSHAQLIQWSCSDWAWLMSRISAYPVWLIGAPEQSVSILKPDIGQAPQGLVLKAAKQNAGIELRDMKYRRDSRRLPSQLSVNYWDVTQQKSRSVKAKSPTVGSGVFKPLTYAVSDAMHWTLNSGLPLSETEAQSFADARLLGCQLAGTQAEFTVDWSEATAKLAPGQTLELSGYGTFDGKGLIAEVRHQWLGAGQGKTILTTGRPNAVIGLQVPEIDAPLMPRVQGMAPGVVVKPGREKDPTGWGCMAVRVPGLGGKPGQEPPVWVRPGMAYASKGSGLCLYPEADDEVMLAFLSDDPRFPVIVSAVHNPKNKAPFEPSEKNEQKGLVLAKDGKTQFQWLFDVKDGGTLTLEAQKTALMMSKASLRLHGEEAFALDAKKITVEAKEGLTLKNGQSEMKMGGTSLSAKSQTLSLQGSAKADLKGGQVNLG
ncbi:hypothetical protein KQH60_00400 [Mycetohabitans sp. B8]|uniref:phage baseplate assembly protein V n=1 Tax=Mycetohabitans sp. B8 TaxID=2841845 RepID=UPI001F1FFA7F|nr:phage baseplate assembly protein V [Mycetohabitans sp. B8]MCG1041107.1 hypothetical protein [Mycetohabitans sp. B8]